MLPLCAHAGVGTIPWSPLARGRLTRDWDESTSRSSSDPFADMLYTNEASDRAIVKAVADVAQQRGVSRAQVALAWLRHNPVVVAPLVGASHAAHIDDAMHLASSQARHDRPQIGNVCRARRFVLRPRHPAIIRAVTDDLKGGRGEASVNGERRDQLHARRPDADASGDAGQLGVTGDSLEVVPRGVRRLQRRHLVVVQLDVE